MNASQFRIPTGPASVCNIPSAASMVASRARESVAVKYYNSDGSSRRPSHTYSHNHSSQEHIISGSKDHYEHHNPMDGAAPVMTVVSRNGWTSYKSQMSPASTNTHAPTCSDGKFRISFSFRQTKIPDGYPKLDFERNPRRESCVAEFSRKLAEGYDIWYDEDRPVINWRYPQMPIRANRTHDLRLMANRERINKMMEREKQMNKRTSTVMKGPSERKDTAWWEQAKKQRPSTTFRGSQPQTNRIPWTSTTPQRSSYYNAESLHTPRR